MIEHLFKKKMIREFLKKYSTNQWPQVISEVFEIGVLNLQNSFHTMYFTKETFQNIINDLKSQLNVSFNANANSHDFISKDKASIINMNNRIDKKAIKPSKNWRSGDPQDNYKVYPQGSNYNFEHQIRDEEVFNDDKYEVKKKKKKGDRYHHQGEIFVRKENETENQRSRSNSNNSKSRPRFDYRVNQDDIREKNKENSHRVQSIESKIKAEVNNDKTTYEFIKNQANKTKEQSGNQKGQTEASNIKNNKNGNINKVNYVINFDKQLKPESIQKKTKQNEEVIYCKKKNKEGNRQIRKTPERINKEYRESNEDDNQENEQIDYEYDNNPMQYENNDDDDNNEQYRMEEREQDQDQEQMYEDFDNLDNNNLIKDQPVKASAGKQLMTNIKSIDSNNNEIERQFDKENQFKSVNNSENNVNNPNNNENVNQNYNPTMNYNNKNNLFYYENKQNVHSKYQPAQYNNIKVNSTLNNNYGNSNSQLDNNENLSSHNDNNIEYEPIRNSQRGIEKDNKQDQGKSQLIKADEEEKSAIKKNAEGSNYQYQHVDDLAKEQNYNQKGNNEFRYRNYSEYQQRKNEERDLYNQANTINNSQQPYQYHSHDVSNIQIDNQYHNNRNANAYLNRQQQSQPQQQLQSQHQYRVNNSHEMNQNNNQKSQQYIEEQEQEQDQYNSHDISFKQSNQENYTYQYNDNYDNTDNQLNEGQLSMLNLSDRTKLLFRRELNHWIPRNQQEYQEGEEEEETKQINNPNYNNQQFLKNRFVYQMESDSNATNNLMSSNENNHSNSNI